LSAGGTSDLNHDSAGVVATARLQGTQRNTGSPSGGGAWPPTRRPRGTGSAGVGWRRGPYERRGRV